MRFGQLMLCDRREGVSSQLRYEQLMEEVVLMDNLGYWSVWFAEHHFDGYALIPDSLGREDGVVSSPINCSGQDTSRRQNGLRSTLKGPGCGRP